MKEETPNLFNFVETPPHQYIFKLKNFLQKSQKNFCKCLLHYCDVNIKETRRFVCLFIYFFYRRIKLEGSFYPVVNCCNYSDPDCMTLEEAGSIDQ